MIKYCPLCHSTKTQFFFEDKIRSFNKCEECSLVFALEEHRLDESAEKARYDLHTNSPDDKGYRKYLMMVLDPVVARVQKDACGLDFGSGPGPTLSLMFEEAGYKMKIYDHFYARDEEALKQKYDFITSTEVIEHLYDPKMVMDNLWGMLKEKGLLTFLTQVYPDVDAFEKWYYKNDLTHVCFFSLETMHYLEKKWQAKLEIIGKDLFLFRRV